MVTKKKNTKLRGCVLYRGPSAIDGAPIVVVATFDSDNRKTGNMVQIWIQRSDVHPVAAIRSGADRAICGDCVHRGNGIDGGGRSCYVNVGQAPATVWQGDQRGIYPELTTDIAQRYLVGRPIRLGSYGDPAAVPEEVWRNLFRVARTTRWTGYTHQWRKRPDLKDLCMASCDSIAEAAEAIANGWRPFVVLSGSSDASALPMRTIPCPASAENPRTTCDRCTLCAGSSERTARAPAITIQAHGSGAVYIAKRAQATV